MRRTHLRKPTAYCIQQSRCILQPHRNCPRSFPRTGPHARRQHSFNDVTHRLLSPVRVDDRWHEKNEDRRVNPVARIEVITQNAALVKRRVVRRIEAANSSEVAGCLPVVRRKPLHPLGDHPRPLSTVAPPSQRVGETMHQLPLLAENIHDRLRICSANFASHDAVCNRSRSAPLPIRPFCL